MPAVTGDITGFEAGVLRRPLDLLEDRLIGAFTVGPVADHRPKTVLGQGLQIADGDLWADGQFVGYSSDIHVHLRLTAR